MKQISLFLCLAGIIPALVDGQDRDQRIADLEKQLTEAKGSIAALQKPSHAGEERLDDHVANLVPGRIKPRPESGVRARFTRRRNYGDGVGPASGRRSGR